MSRTAWMVLSTRQFFSMEGQVNSRAHGILFSTEEQARAYVVKLKTHSATWEVGLSEVPVNEDASTAPLPEPTKEN